MKNELSIAFTGDNGGAGLAASPAGKVCAPADIRVIDIIGQTGK